MERAREALPLLTEAAPEKGKRRGDLLTNSHTVFVDSRREGKRHHLSPRFLLRAHTRTRLLGAIASPHRPHTRTIRLLRMEQSAFDLPANTRIVYIFRFRCSVRDFDTAEHFETAPELVGRKFNRPRVQDLEAGPVLRGTTDRKSLKVRA